MPAGQTAYKSCRHLLNRQFSDVSGFYLRELFNPLHGVSKKSFRSAHSQLLFDRDRISSVFYLTKFFTKNE
jgi:hypothetical protein